MDQLGVKLRSDQPLPVMPAPANRVHTTAKMATPDVPSAEVSAAKVATISSVVIVTMPAVVTVAMPAKPESKRYRWPITIVIR